MICVFCPSKFYKNLQKESCEKCPEGAECENGTISNIEG